MRRLILCFIIQQLLFFTSSVESLIGQKIVEAKDRDVSFVASIRNASGHHICLGSLITDKHVITAPHCLSHKLWRDISILLRILHEANTITVRYEVGYWITRRSWATRQGLQLTDDFDDIAIIILTQSVTHPNVIPIRLTDLNKKQVQGKTATIFGGLPEGPNLAEASVDILSDDDCDRKVRLITNRNLKTSERILCTAAKPYVLLQLRDAGGPLLDKFGALIGVHTGVGPMTNFSWGHFSDEFLHRHKFNLHLSIPYFLQFIVNATGYH